MLAGMTATQTPAPVTRGYSEEKDQLLNRLRRIEGQTRGIQKMVEDDRWCPDILQQIAAVRAALDKVALGLAEGHVQHCMLEGTSDPKRQQEMTAELMQALGRLVR
jgi:CsoR family transcriptional regulator, copper-sensing transcriptional repressor